MLKFQVNSLMSAVAPNALKHDMKGTDGGKDSVCVRTFFDSSFKNSKIKNSIILQFMDKVTRLKLLKGYCPLLDIGYKLVF